MKKLFMKKKLWNNFSQQTKKKLRKCKTLTLASAIILNETENELFEEIEEDDAC